MTSDAHRSRVAERWGTAERAAPPNVRRRATGLIGRDLENGTIDLVSSDEESLSPLAARAADAALAQAAVTSLLDAHMAATHGNEAYLRALCDGTGPAAALSAVNEHGSAPAHAAAENGHSSCLLALHELGAAATLSLADSDGNTPAHVAAESGHSSCLRLLHTLGAVATLSAVNAAGSTPAHRAAQNGHADCLRALHELGAEATLSEEDGDGNSLAHIAAMHGYADCLRALHDLGVTLSPADAKGWTPAHWAARNGHDGCLCLLHELGAEATLYAETREDDMTPDGMTPAHFAAINGHDNCLRELRRLLVQTITPQLAAIKTVQAAGVRNVILELKAKQSLRWSSNAALKDPATLAFEANRQKCFELLAQWGGATEVWAKLTHSPLLIPRSAWLLSKPSLLNLPAKRAWLGVRLDAKVGNASGASLSLVARRGHVLQGLCAQLGIDEATGRVGQGASAQPRRLNVQYEGEASSGDALRREWFGLALNEMLDPDRGLFVSNDRNRTLQPNPASATTAGADHLSYFALLGRIAGLALYHRETLNAPWSLAFLKSTFGFEITFADLHTVDPTLHDSLAKLEELGPEDLAACELTFVANEEEAIVYEKGCKRPLPSELKPGGESIEVTVANLHEYLQLYAQHKLVNAIHHQVAAFREGLGVFVDARLRKRLCKCCTVAEVQLLLCGVPDINVQDWEASAQYNPESFATSSPVRWFWEVLAAMAPEDRAKLLFFCTGSGRVPATGFHTLQGYNGHQMRFTLHAAQVAEAGRLPTASACFNTLHLPRYATRAELKAKLLLAINGAEGFSEAAVAQ